ncbi:hypothetical protein [Nannocystis sp. SCPEA4]|uniref:hypothetical protein n=1 Tax=Nannocystis sp. SCPEA4 TaxID=2996787 RepID=UPI002270BDF2|nr:hypothetical protein [Nannocystis sp. SCPEA4]MCY1057721.1 hypothetical protein [Nannocystis sp. SCPEA4]
MSNQGDWSWSEEALYACPCGSLVAVRRWRWLDRQARPELVGTLRTGGPLVGACSRCRRPATGGGAWLEVDADRGAATLVLSADRRGDLIAALQAHLADLKARPELAAPWLLQPEVAFVPVPPPWAEEAGEAAPELSPWPGPALGSRGQESGRAGDSELSGPEARVDETGSKGHVPATRNGAVGEAGRRRESSGPTAVEARRREGSGPVVAAGRRRESSGPGEVEAGRRAESGETGRRSAGSGEIEAGRRAESGETGRRGAGPGETVEARKREESRPIEAAEANRRREASGPSEADARKARLIRGANLPESLEDTFPGRRRTRAIEDELQETAHEATRRPAAVLEGPDAVGRRTLPDEGRRPAALEGPGGPLRPAAVLEGTGSNGQDAGGMSSGAGRRPAAVLEGPDVAGRRAGPEDGARRPAAVLEGTGASGQDSGLMSSGAGRRADEGARRPAAVLEGPDVAGRRGGADEGARRPAAVLEGTGANGQDSGLMASGPGRRPAAVLEGAGSNGQDSGLMSSGAGRRADEGARRPAAVLEGAGSNGQDSGLMSSGAGRRAGLDEPAGRRPAAVLEGTGSNGQERRPAAVIEPAAEVDGERSALRAAVARALSPSSPAQPGRPGNGESGPRPAAVLPGQATEAGAADSSGTWSRRQVEAADAAARRGIEGAGDRVSEAAVTGTWPKRQVLESAADSGPNWPRRDEAGRAPSRAPTPPPVRLGADVQRAALASLGRDGGAVQVTVNLNEATARVWASAPVKVRPIHLRGLGYPLVGVRCVAEAGGESLVVDAVVDVGEPMTLDLFKQLTREFKIRLVLPGGQVRELAAPELQRNAASCLESAQAQLGTGEFPPDAYRTARELLSGLNVAQRLEPARTPIAETLGETARESAAGAWTALERLDHGSRKDNLARMLEVDGLSVETYEKIRSAVLGAAIEFGLPAPARFWRRWLGSDQARDGGTFVQKLIAARTASIARGEDLTPEQAEAAWRGILDLCQHKNLTPPPELSKALGLGKVTTGRRASQPQIKATAEVREAPPVQEARSQARLRELTGRLRGSDGDVRAVIGSLPELSENEVVSLLPALAELGSRVGPELLAGLRAPQRHVRQAAAILLGHLGERKAEGPLVAMLGDEPSAGWVDAARALGNLGPRVVGPLCNLLRSTPTGRKEVVGARVARALAELIKAEGAGPGGSGRVAVENLLEVGDPSVSSAARRALATLGAVRDDAEGDDAEASRRFSRLASDAIAPELDAAEDDEIDEVEVEVGD